MGGGQLARGVPLPRAMERRLLARRASVLLVLAASTSCCAIALIMMFVWFVLSDDTSSWAGFTSASTLLVGGATFAAGMVLLLSATALGSLLPASVVSRRAMHDADPRVRELVYQLGLAAGIREPSVAVIDDPVVNTTVRRRAGKVSLVLTDAACTLPSSELSALIAFDLAVMASPELRRVRSVLASVALLNVILRLLWGLLFASFVMSIATGQSLPWGLGMLVGSFGPVVLFPLGLATAAAVVTLVMAANTIADRDAVSMTFQPDAYLTVLLRVMQDQRRTRTGISPLGWFERTTMRDDLPAIVGSAMSQPELVHRAEQMAAIAAIPLPEPWPPLRRSPAPSDVPKRRRKHR